MIAYDRYTENLSKQIYKIITPTEFPAHRQVNDPAGKAISYQ